LKPKVRAGGDKTDPTEVEKLRDELAALQAKVDRLSR
jgi:hypothetical protein